MDGIVFLKWDELIIGHRNQLEKYGGQEGFIDENVVRAAMARPEFKAKYDPDADLADLAAAYLYGLCTTQGFLDGNKRAAAIAAILFLGMNGWEFTITSELIYVVTMGVAATTIDEETLARIIRDHVIVIDDESGEGGS